MTAGLDFAKASWGSSLPAVNYFAVAVGSNRGEREAIIAEACALVTADGDLRIEAASPLITSAALGGPPGQGAYRNGAWIIATALGAHQVLHRLQGIETQLGRVRTQRNGARTLDLDLLLAEDGLVINSGVLCLPHPRMSVRRFVLEPLALIAGNWRHPLLRRSVRELLSVLPAPATQADR